MNEIFKKYDWRHICQRKAVTMTEKFNKIRLAIISVFRPPHKNNCPGLPNNKKNLGTDKQLIYTQNFMQLNPH